MIANVIVPSGTMQIFFTGVKRDAVSFFIRLFESTPLELLCGRLWPYSHVGWIYHFTTEQHFTYSFDHTTIEHTFAPGFYYFESIWKKNTNPEYGTTGKNGVRGPIPLANLMEWQDENPDKRTVEFCSIPSRPDQIKKTLGLSFWARDFIRYAPALQFVGNAAKVWRKAYISTDRWHCAEAVARVLCQQKDKFWERMFQIGTRYLFDAMSPRHVHKGIDAAWRHVEEVARDMGLPPSIYSG